jgi:hypothetical protein
MNPDLVAQITKLVLAKLEESNTTTSTSSLSESEIKRWNEINASLPRSSSESSDDGMYRQLQPLSSVEVKSWNAITERIQGRSFPKKDSDTGQIKFYSHN